MQPRRTPFGVVVHTPAKLNLFLEVLARREDGFHEIETLMIAVSLYDTVIVQPMSHTPDDEQAVEFSCRWAGKAPQGVLGGLPSQEKNSAVRALRLFQQAAQVHEPTRLALRKRIPSEAGLGGASSDAAAVLRAANAAWSIHWPAPRLEALAAELGSDTPFFCGPPAGHRGAWAAICTGRGERIEPIAGIPRMHFVIVKPPQGLSTPRVYSQCRPASSPRRAAPLVEALRAGRGDLLRRHLFNRLQEPARDLLGWIGRLEAEFARHGCLAHQMSGSGSSYFGIFSHGRRARSVAARLRSRGLGGVYYAASL